MRLTKLAFGMLAIVVCLGPNNLYAQSQAIDVNKSSLKIRVFKSGAFSAFAHDHEIQAMRNTSSFHLSENIHSNRSVKPNAGPLRI